MSDPFAPAPQPSAPDAPPAHDAPPAPAAFPPRTGDDVKVAGHDLTQVGAPAGDTLGFQALPAEPPGAGARDEIASGGEPPRSTTPRGGSGGRNGLRVAAVLAGAAVAIGGGAVGAFALTGGSGDDGATVKPTEKLADAAPKVDPEVLEEQRRRLALERASRETRQDDGGELDLRPKGEPLPTKTPEQKKDDDDGGGGGGGGAPTGDPVPAGEAQRIAKQLMPGFGFTGDGQFGCLVKLWDKESGWNVHADNPSSAAYGIPQANPGKKMASAGPDWRNNAKTQIKWGLGYIKDRYNTPCGAWSHSQSAGWY